MWDLFLNKNVLFGAGRIKETAGILQQQKVQKVFIVTYDGQAPVVLTLQGLLKDNDLGFTVYDAVKTEPDLHVINKGTHFLKIENCDAVLAVGGGSVLDAAKAIAMLATNGGLIEEYQMGQKTVVKPTLPVVVIPTTSGTGSEATKVSVIHNNYNGLKKSAYSNYMIAETVILDPEVTLSLPARLTASTGMDALSHAIESYVSLNANPMTEMWGLKAIELINRSLVKAVHEGNDAEARGDMMLASYLAGCALHAGIGIAHIIAQPLGGMFKIPHGDACSIFLPIAMEVNLEYSVKKYCKIAEALGINTTGLTEVGAARLGIKRIAEIRAQANAPQKLSEYVDCDSLSLDEVLVAIEKSTGHIKCNPRPVDRSLLAEVIKKAM
jgi:alcohol dehydrogenase class IV